jgi:hypothetical protein
VLEHIPHQVSKLFSNQRVKNEEADDDWLGEEKHRIELVVTFVPSNRGGS